MKVKLYVNGPNWLLVFFDMALEIYLIHTYAGKLSWKQWDYNWSVILFNNEIL